MRCFFAIWAFEKVILIYEMRFWIYDLSPFETSFTL